MSSELDALGDGLVPDLVLRPPLGPGNLATLVDVTQWRATVQPLDPAFTFLENGETEAGCFSFAQLDAAARAIAAELQAHTVRGDRVLLIVHPGLEYIAALFGCLYAGLVAVPVYPPDPFRLQRTLPRIRAILQNAEANYVLTSQGILPWLLGPLGEDCGVKIQAVEAISGDAASDFRTVACRAEDLALLQYTSGSTGTPRGVMLTHQNLTHNLTALLRLDFADVVGVCWLPPYHDMGLIGGVLLPVFCGRHNVLMSPLSFVERPVRWLSAITQYRATTTGGPNFGYELCVRRVRPEECDGLDLSSWMISISSAEPVRAATIDRFVEKFGPYGFRREVFYPAYGLAEATVIVSGGKPEALPVIRSFSAEELKQHRAIEVEPNGTGSRRLVGCGQPVPEIEIVVADAATGARLGPGHAGEIWVRGPSVGRGYFNRPDETREAFQAHLAGDSGDDNGASFLRTGDLGFVDRGELFVTGRLKELIILSGRNFYPQDIEQTVHQAHRALKRDGGAAFSIEIDNEEQLVIVQEARRSKRFNLEDAITAIRHALAEEHGLMPYAVVLIAGGTLPKTSSGKLRRFDCRQMFLDNELKPLSTWTARSTVVDGRAGTSPETETQRAVADIWRTVLGVTGVYQEDDFFALGGHSLLAMQMAVRLEQHFGVKVPIRDVFKSPTVRQTALQIERKLALPASTGGHLAEQGSADLPRPIADSQQIPLLNNRNHTPLSFAEQRIWFAERLEPGHPFYNMPLAARVSGALDQTAVAKSLSAIVARHEALRTTYYLQDGEPRRQIHDPHALEIAPRLVDLTNAPSEELGQRIYHESRRPFDLIDGPLLRYTVYRVAEDEHIVLLVLHHIVGDGWSMGVMLSEFAECYRAQLAGENPLLPPLRLQYADFADWQRTQLADQRLSELLDFWHHQLDGAPAVLDLPLDHPRPAVQDFDGRQLTFALSAGLTAQIRQYCKAAQITPFTFLLSAYCCLLSRLSGQTDVCVGTVAASRTTAGLESLIGFFVNTLVIRATLEDDPIFDELVQRIGETALQAQAHGELPFEKLVEHIAANRDRRHSPIFQAAFVYQRPLGELLGGPGLSIEPLRIDNGTAKHDLTFEFDDVGDRFVATVHYRSALFARESIERFVRSFQIICEGVVREPDRRVSEVAVLDPAQRRQVLDEFNATDFDFGAPHTVHELFEGHARRRPGELAIIGEDRNWTYEQLSLWSDEIAAGLVAFGVARAANVATYLPRSSELEAAMLGIFKAGARYVPLNTEQPPKRCRTIIEQCDNHPEQPLFVVVSDDQAGVSLG